MEEDTSLVAQALANPHAYAKIVEKYEKPLLRYLLRISNISKEEAEDLFQNVFLKAYENLNDFDRSLKFSSWIYRIAHNEAISAWRKRNARVEEVSLDNLEASNLFVSTFEVASKLDTKILAKDVKQTLAKLDAKYREVLILYYLEDKSYEEISDILRKPMGSIATLISRAKDNFKKLFTSQFPKLKYSYSYE